MMLCGLGIAMIEADVSLPPQFMVCTAVTCHSQLSAQSTTVYTCQGGNTV